MAPIAAEEVPLSLLLEILNSKKGQKFLKKALTKYSRRKRSPSSDSSSSSFDSSDSDSSSDDEIEDLGGQLEEKLQLQKKEKNLEEQKEKEEPSADEKKCPTHHGKHGHEKHGRHGRHGRRRHHNHCHPHHGGHHGHHGRHHGGGCLPYPPPWWPHHHGRHGHHWPPHGHHGHHEHHWPPHGHEEPWAPCRRSHSRGRSPVCHHRSRSHSRRVDLKNIHRQPFRGANEHNWEVGYGPAYYY